MARRRIYLDYAASTPLDPKALKAMMPYLKQEYGNPSSSHAFGQAARAAIEQARSRVAGLLGAEPGEVVFTSGATEANNLAIQGGVRASGFSKPHVVTSQIEHESVLAPIQALEKRGEIEATYVGVGKEGVLDASDIEKALRKNTALVSVQYANSETGVLQPIGQIGKLLEKYKIQDTRYTILFHTDAVQAVPFLDCSLARLHANLLTCSSHKLYGPKGAGALAGSKGTKILPLLLGGGQENGLRSGTENTAAIAGFGAAASEAGNGRTKIAAVKVRQLRDRMLKMLKAKIPDMKLAGSLTDRLPGILSIVVPGVLGSELVIQLDQRGVAVSTGSACSERSQEPSRVLLAMGFSPHEALSVVRITLGRPTTAQEVEYGAKAFAAAVTSLRRRAS